MPRLNKFLALDPQLACRCWFQRTAYNAWHGMNSMVMHDLEVHDMGVHSMELRSLGMYCMCFARCRRAWRGRV
jgi:hypothetical protein